jgi:hypothetical protein
MIKKILILLLLIYYGKPTYSQIYSGITFYVIPHQEDWQLYMGNSAWNDIRTFHERGYPFTINHAQPGNGTGKFPNGLKVVLINITGGNTNYLPGGSNDPCTNIYPPEYRTPVPYWEANEAAENKSIYIAASRPKTATSPPADSTQSGARNYDDGWGNATGLASTFKQTTTTINGHKITIYTYKNVIAYYLRIDETAIIAGTGIHTLDNSGNYDSYTDLVQTISNIYEYEMFNEVAKITSIEIKTFDHDSAQNPTDHPAHYYTARLAVDAATAYNHCPRVDFTFKLYQGYNTASLPVNLSADETNPQMERKSALYSAYCLGMLQHNARIDWNSQVKTGGYTATDLHSREYNREITISGDTTCTHKNTVSYSIYPNPVNGKLSIQFSEHCAPEVDIRIMDVYNRLVYHNTNISTVQSNIVEIDTTEYADGLYYIILDDGKNSVLNKMFLVQHTGR